MKVVVNAVVPLKESLCGQIVEVARALEPFYPEITLDWRELILREVAPGPRTLAALERITLATGWDYLSRDDFDGLFENLNYYGTRLAKLQMDTRIVWRALDSYHELCEPYVASLFPERPDQTVAVLDMFFSAAFAAISGAYSDTRSKETKALLAVLDVELVDNELAGMLQRVLEIVCGNFGASFGAVLLREPESELLLVQASLGMDASMYGQFNSFLGADFAASIDQGEPMLIMTADRGEATDDLHDKIPTLWVMPLKSEGRITGAGALLVGFARPYEWLPTERELMRAIADRSALAIHRARIAEALREREVRIAELSAHLLRVQEEERKHISRELHDETGQSLMVIRLYLGMLESTLRAPTARAKVKETVAVVDRAIEGIRRIIGRLSPLVLDELGLFAAIRKEVKDLERTHKLKTRVAIADEVGRLAPEAETAIYRIVQEALHNIAKHARATRMGISMARENDMIHLVVEDDGVGIFPKTSFRGKSFGLAGIRERVAMLGGEVRLISMKGEGTRIEISLLATDQSNSQSNYSAAPLVAANGAAAAQGDTYAKD